MRIWTLIYYNLLTVLRRKDASTHDQVLKTELIISRRLSSLATF